MYLRAMRPQAGPTEFETPGFQYTWNGGTSLGFPVLGKRERRRNAQMKQTQLWTAFKEER